MSPTPRCRHSFLLVRLQSHSNWQSAHAFGHGPHLVMPRRGSAMAANRRDTVDTEGPHYNSVLESHHSGTPPARFSATHPIPYGFRVCRCGGSFFSLSTPTCTDLFAEALYRCRRMHFPGLPPTAGDGLCLAMTCQAMSSRTPSRMHWRRSCLLLG